MEAKPIDQIREELLEVLGELSVSQQEEVLDFALFLHHRGQTHSQRFGQQEPIALEEATTLKAEFAEEDATLTEAVMHDYLTFLQREDHP